MAEEMERWEPMRLHFYMKPGDKFPRMCYSTITALYSWRGLKDGQIPYLDSEVE